MVGVAGKYKGCETCRRRRVKCDNTRPLCKKCTDSGRECEGYERERVFIMATIDDGGRCSSHPPRQIQGSRKKAKAERKEKEKLELVPCLPLAPAWDNAITLSNRGTIYLAQFASLQTVLGAVSREQSDDASVFSMTMPSYATAEPQLWDAVGDFEAPSQCIVRLAGDGGGGSQKDSLCLFLYEQKSFVGSNENTAPWRIPREQMCEIRGRGPEAFQSFPEHHYFVRVYRHSAISDALINRRETFLASPEWTMVPWEAHPKSLFDRLFDIVVLLPSIFTRTDRILPHPPTQTRCLRAQDLLANCLHVERQFEDWYSVAIQGSGGRPHSYWIEDPGGPAPIPFGANYGFQDGTSAVMFVHYWMSLLLFHRCVDSLHRAIYQPVIAAYPNMYPVLPANLVINPSKYQQEQSRELAVNICRALDVALSETCQPDMLLGPLAVVQDFYREINASSGDAELEIIWCENFRMRLVARGQRIADIASSGAWAELARF